MTCVVRTRTISLETSSIKRTNLSRREFEVFRPKGSKRKIEFTTEESPQKKLVGLDLSSRG